MLFFYVLVPRLVFVAVVLVADVVATGVVAVVIVVLLQSLFFRLISLSPFSNKALLVPGAQLCIASYRYAVNSCVPSPNNPVVLLETRSHSLSDCMRRV